MNNCRLHEMSNSSLQCCAQCLGQKTHLQLSSPLCCCELRLDRLDCGGLELEGFEPADLQEEGLQDRWKEVPLENHLRTRQWTAEKYDLKRGITNKKVF